MLEAANLLLRLLLRLLARVACWGVVLFAAGCGTTRWTDTTRTATEQMLVSDAVDRAVSRIDFSLLAGKEVYLDAVYLERVVDKEYVTSTLRQHMLASGCVIKEKKDEAEFIVEARAGAVGTDRHDLLFGVPAINLAGFNTVPGVPNQLPEIAFARRTDQQGVARVAVFAYHRDSGKPVWQSGSEAVASNARDFWLLGAGPFQQGTIYDGTQFAGDELKVPLIGRKKKNKVQPNPSRVTRQSIFNNPTFFAKNEAPAADDAAKVAMQPDKPAANETPAPNETQPAALFIPAPATTPLPPPAAVDAGAPAQPAPPETPFVPPPHLETTPRDRLLGTIPQ